MTQQINTLLIKDQINKVFDPLEHKIDIIQQNVDKQKIYKIITTDKHGIKLTKNEFTEETIDMMNELMNKSDEYSIEHGAVLCASKMSDKYQKIHLGNICDGTNCLLDLSKSGCKDYEKIGAFHTHPNKSFVRFSLGDLILHLEHEYLINCVGAGGVIVCKISKNEDYYRKKVNFNEVLKHLQIEQDLNNKKYVNEKDHDDNFDFKDMIENKFFNDYILQGGISRDIWEEKHKKMA